MPFEPASLVELGEQLVGDETVSVEEQCRFRTALNRAYYGPLLVLIQRIEQVHGPGTVPTESTHYKIRESLKRTRIGHLLQIKHKLDRLRADREQADYVLHREDFPRSHIEDTLGSARSLVEELRGRLPDDKVARISF